LFGMKKLKAMIAHGNNIAVVKFGRLADAPAVEVGAIGASEVD